MTMCWVWVCSISVCLMPKFEMSVCDLCLSVINVCLGNDCVALISCFDGIFCARWLCAGCLYAEWLSSGCVSRISALYECLFRMSDCYVFVMGACRGSLFCMSVCIMYVCRIYILDVCVFDDCLAIVDVRHLCVFNARNLKLSVCRMSVINVCLGNDCVALIAVSFLWWDLLSWRPLCGISVCWMAEISLGVSKISAMDECLLDNCLKISECWMPEI